MNTATQLFADYLNKKDIKYTVERDHVIRVGFSGENMPTIRAHFIFDENARHVEVVVFSIAKTSESTLNAALIACSKLNSEYRWVKFYLDSDKEVTARIDAIIDPFTTGEMCYEMLMRIIDIVDESYPKLMKMLWA